jgi:hypothetical protein
MTSYEGWNCFAKSFLKLTEYIHSTFDVHQFLCRFDWPFFWLAAGLNLEPLNLYQSNLVAGEVATIF